MIGSAKLDLDTPALCIDLDALEFNIGQMARFMNEHGLAWRPHQKCHKLPAIAHRQRQAGAIGVTCARVSEAEVMAAAGIPDLLIANMVVGHPKWERLAALCRSARPIVACDDLAQVEPLAEICHRRGVTCRVLVELDLGMQRVGVRPGPRVLELAQAIDRLPGLEFSGVMGYEGHLLMVPDRDEKQRRIAEALGQLVHAAEQLSRHGLSTAIVSAGGTGSYQQACHCQGLTEIQAGGGIFADPLYQLSMGLEGLQYALTVLTTVVSCPTRERVIVDAGRKSLHTDLQLPLVKDRPGVDALRFSAEHGELKQVSPQLKIGDKVELIVGYADLTTVLHDHFHGFRGETLEAIWPILGRFGVR